MNIIAVSTIVFVVVGMAMFPLVFAYHATTILNPAGASVPGCEETDECFIPSVVTVDVGSAVTWINKDVAAHTITSGMLADGGPDGVFDSGLFAPETEFSHTFEEVGKYPYFCMVHPWMSGLVIVEDASSEETEPHGEMPSNHMEDGEVSSSMAPSTGRIYENEDLNISMMFPEGWEIRQRDADSLNVVGTTSTFSIDMWTGNISLDDTLRVVGELIRVLQESGNVGNVEMLSAERATISGREMIILDTRIHGLEDIVTTLKYRIVTTVADNSWYMFSFLSLEDNFDADLPLFEAALLSFSVLDESQDLESAHSSTSMTNTQDMLDSCIWHRDLKVDLHNMDLRGMDLSCTNLSEVDLWGVNLQNTNLEGANLVGANLGNADLSGTNLHNANLRNANLRNVDFNQYVGTIDLSGANLQSANMQSANLEGANLQNADLQHSNLWNADLEGASLEEAELGNADLSGANLRNANLRNAILEGANLKGASLEDVYMSSINLLGTNLRGASLKSANLEGANLEGADLGNADLSDANLRNANLRNATLDNVGFNTFIGSVDLSNANLQYASIQHAKLKGANLRNADLEHSNLRNADLEGANLGDVNLRNADLEGANLGDVNLRNADLEGTKLDGTNLEGVDLSDVDLSGADLRNIILRNADLRNIDLSNIDLSGANLRGANLEGIDLSGANLRGAFLRGANLEGANLEGADLRDVDLLKVDLSDANLRDADLRGAILRNPFVGTADLSGADLVGANLEGVDLINVNLVGTVLDGVDLYSIDLGIILDPNTLSEQGPSLSGLDLSNMDIRGVDLSGVNMQNTNLQGANLRNANLARADLSDADLSGADLRNANLTNTILDSTNLEGADLRGAIALDVESLGSRQTPDTVYTYTIANTSFYDRFYPDYSGVVDQSVAFGLTLWEDVNQHIGFRYVSDFRNADFVVNMGGTGEHMSSITPIDIYGSVNEVGCLVDSGNNCTVTLFVEGGHGAATSLFGHDMIEFVIAHEVGHLLGFPHHSSSFHLMHSGFDDTSTWYDDSTYGLVAPLVHKPLQESISLDIFHRYSNLIDVLVEARNPTSAEREEFMQYKPISFSYAEKIQSGRATLDDYAAFEQTFQDMLDMALTW